MYAQGRFQREVETALFTGQEIKNPVPRKGRAGRYAPLYKKSLENLFERMRKDGWKIIFSPGPKGGDVTPGPRGGEWSGTYRLVPAELDEIAAVLYPSYREDAPVFYTLLSIIAAGYSRMAKAALLGLDEDDCRSIILSRLAEIDKEKDAELLSAFLPG